MIDFIFEFFDMLAAFIAWGGLLGLFIVCARFVMKKSKSSLIFYRLTLTKNKRELNEKH